MFCCMFDCALAWEPISVWASVIIATYKHSMARDATKGQAGQPGMPLWFGGLYLAGWPRAYMTYKSATRLPHHSVCTLSCSQTSRTGRRPGRPSCPKPTTLNPQRMRRLSLAAKDGSGAEAGKAETPQP